MPAPAAQLLIGRTVHLRETPFRRRFSYPVAMLDIDVDRLKEAGRQACLFAVNRFNLVAFHSCDQAERRKGSRLRAWAEEQFALAGLAAPHSLRLLCFPRVLGLGFSPISLWLGKDADDRLTGIIYEVHNTFGEAHAYVSPATAPKARGVTSKVLHVSPFFDVAGRYRFFLSQTMDRFELIVENIGESARTHLASLLLRPQPLTSRSLIWRVMLLPWAGAGVILAIHWQALILWLKGAGYRHKPPQAGARTTLVAEQTPQRPEQSEDPL
jgi:hypothetical protein